MISCDTDILYAACNRDAVGHEVARAFLLEQGESSSFVLCEQVLMELYCLLRNPAVTLSPLTSAAAVAWVRRLRTNPCWRIVDVPAHRTCMEFVWQAAEAHAFAFRRIFDLRLAATLVHHGVDTFVTRNIKDFSRCGFKRVYDPCGR